MPTTCRPPTRPGPTVRELWRSTDDLARAMHFGRRATAIPEIDFFAFYVDWRALSASSKAHGARALHLESAVCSDVRLSPAGVDQDGIAAFSQFGFDWVVLIDRKVCGT